jgi:septum site-determining protein MinD
MGDIIVIASGKGGVGKSTTVANLGCRLAMAGKSVVMIDADTGLRNLDVILGQSDRIVYDLTDVTEGRCSLSDALLDCKEDKKLYFLPTSQTKEKSAVTKDEMKKLTGELSQKFDYVLIDSPAGIEAGFENAVAGAARAVVVVTPEYTSIRDADRILEGIENAGIKDCGLVINRYRHDMAISGDMPRIDEIIELLAVDLLGVVPEDVKVLIAANKGIPVSFDKLSIAGKAFENIADRILGKEVPLMGFDEKRSIISRLFRKKQHS